MILIFSVLLYPIFFIIAYVIGEYIFPTRNSAMFFAFLCAFLFSFIYYTIRKQVSQLTEKKLQKKQLKEQRLTALMLTDEKIFKNCFPKNTLADNSYTGVNEDKLITFLRENKGEVHIFSIKGMTEGAKDFLKLINVKYIEHSLDELLEKTENIILPKITVENKKDRLKKIKSAFKSPAFKKFALKYGVILLLLSIITPYKIYYILFGSFLILYSITAKIIDKINLRNQIPYPRS